MEKTPVPGVDQGGRVLDEDAAGPREHDVDDLIQELLEMIQSSSSFGDYRRMQRKECFNLVRRMKLVVPFLEEIKELEDTISDEAYDRICCLHKAFTSARKLLRCCHDGSKIYLVRSLLASIIPTSLFPSFPNSSYSLLGVGERGYDGTISDGLRKNQAVAGWHAVRAAWHYG